jgi:hypothetical protein
MSDKSSSTSSGAGCGIFSAGGVVAFIISWKLWHSIWWALLAAVFGWGYVLYAAIYYLEQIKDWLG